MRVRHIIPGLGVMVFVASIALAQQATPEGRRQRGAAPEPPKNLQVFPKDISREDLLARMRNISGALGAQCGYCHIFEGAGNPANDFASDTKTPKLVARVMMQMTGEINQKLTANIKKPAEQIARVGCMTCHRKQAIPTTPPPAPAPAASEAPAQAPPAGGTVRAPGR